MQSILRSGSAIIYQSTSSCIYYNLLLEDYLLNNTQPDQICLLFYKNRDCVVIGRNQAFYAEVNFTRKDLDFARRYSGGGAVYHDLGNINYSVIMPRSRFDRRWAAEMICAGLFDLNPTIFVNDRNDIYVDDMKCSGSAFRITRERAYHHGTMLLHSNLENLSSSIKSPAVVVEKPSVQSVPAKVTNFSPPLSSDDFIERVSSKFLEAFGNADTVLVPSDLPIDISMMKSTKWIVNKGSSYTFIHNNVLYKYEDGKLTNSRTGNDESILNFE